MKILIVLILLGALVAVLNAEGPATRRVTFRIVPAEQPAANERIFIAGNVLALGQWKADGFALSADSNGTWTGTVDLPADQTVEFKVTKGSWETERSLADGSIPPNEMLPPGGDTEVEVRAAGWKKSGPPPAPRITGDYRIHDAVHSEFLALDRKVIVWLPPSYATDTERRYPVLYMHDGQQIFDPQTSTHGRDWEVDEWCTKLIADGKLQEIIVVGAYCTANRYEEYSPALKGKDYARFLIEELKPMIDREYRTLPGRETTAVAGSSMGGKISFYLAWAHPDVYFGAACLSPAFAYKDDRHELDMVEASTNTPDLRLYFYCGEGDDLERKLIPGMRTMADLLKQRGYEEGRNLLVAEDAPAVHNEAAWQKVTGQWLEFLFGKK